MLITAWLGIYIYIYIFIKYITYSEEICVYIHIYMLLKPIEAELLQYEVIFFTISSAACCRIFLGFYPASSELLETAVISALKGASKTLRVRGWLISCALCLACCGDAESGTTAMGRALPLGSMASDITEGEPWNTVTGRPRNTGPVGLTPQCVSRQRWVWQAGGRLCWTRAGAEGPAAIGGLGLGWGCRGCGPT